MLPVARTLARAFAPGRGAVRRTLAVAAIPFWLLGVLLLPGYVHHRRRIVLRVAPRGGRGVRAYGLRALVLVAVVTALAVLAATSPVAAAIGLGLVAVTWLLVVVGLLVMMPSTIEALGASARVPSSPQARATDRERLRQVGWTVDSAASLEPSGGLQLMRDHLAATLPAGAVVTATAATGKHARVYTRLGFTPLLSQPLRLTHRVREGGAGAS
ncbi:hypothetical protein C8046_02725 [Serinibacter arcticus]|uniref:Uncharacterized protein n=1 Tax=Serinibacter arcticus TaxID=1655435 RepID=A0A2U1ZS06_9MICO|nr:hypothetical protein C8046_02725 [Serinibacter arcticus]